MLIEKAAPADIPDLGKLLSVLFSQEEEFTPNAEAQSTGLAKIISNPEIGAVLLAGQAERVVGMVSLLFTISTALGERVALLEDMVVSPERRGTGVGIELLAEAISFSRSRGCKRSTLLTDRANDAAQRSYGKQGFVVSNMVPMRLLLT
jgi:GNAT superfamily N-acetyltransferase